MIISLHDNKGFEKLKRFMIKIQQIEHRKNAHSHNKGQI